ncbi:hypothetical protein BZA77DRAFT_303572, partial [Pyronema omphalodes]
MPSHLIVIYTSIFGIVACCGASPHFLVPLVPLGCPWLPLVQANSIHLGRGGRTDSAGQGQEPRRLDDEHDR